MALTFDSSNFEAAIAANSAAVNRATSAVMDEILDDLTLYATNIAPIDTGVLRASSTRDKFISEDKVIGEVAFSARQSSSKYGAFNYALWTHEYMRKAQTTGSFEGYTVGNKYLYRPLIGEFQKWNKWWAEAVEKEFRT